MSATTDLAAAASIARGVRLGAAEAKQTAALFGDDVELFEAAGNTSNALIAANQLLAGRQVQVFIGGSSADADALSRFAESHHIVFLNPVSRSQSLRGECRRYTFHIEASDKMYSSASRMNGTSRPSTFGAARSSPAAPSDSVVLWDSRLERFGASQINQRFRDKYHMEMDGPAWAAWMAVKIASESALRVHSTEPTRIVAYLESTATQFDGHKGWPLSFRSVDHQLRQPLYAVAGSPGNGRPRIRDVPDLRASAMPGSDGHAAPSPERTLDALIESPGEKKCSWNARR